jgi:hypothetical protein
VNERIRLLAEQAFLAVGTTHNSINHQDQSVLDKNDTITVYTFTQNTMDKFAELLIRECANVCRDDGRWFQEQDDKLEAGVAYALCYKIKEHFGVEE